MRTLHLIGFAALTSLTACVPRFDMAGHDECVVQDDCLPGSICVEAEQRCVPRSEVAGDSGRDDTGRDAGDSDAGDTNSDDVSNPPDTNNDAAVDPRTDPQADTNDRCPDLDGDGAFSRPGCGPVDCDDNDATVHPAAFELCNGADDDCDGSADEGISLQSDANHCGGCNQVCRAANAVMTCSTGSCSLLGCQAGWDDRNNNASDGCEVQCAAADICGNGIDDDCDDLIDLADADCRALGPLNGREYWYMSWRADLDTGAPSVETGIYVGTDDGGQLTQRVLGDPSQSGWGGSLPNVDAPTAQQGDAAFTIGPAGGTTWTAWRPTGSGDNVLFGTGVTNDGHGVFVSMVELRNGERSGPGAQALSWTASPLSEGALAHDAAALAFEEPTQLAILRFGEYTGPQLTNVHWPFAEYRTGYRGSSDAVDSLLPTSYSLQPNGEFELRQDLGMPSQSWFGAMTLPGALGIFVRHVTPCGPRTDVDNRCVPDPIFGAVIRPDRTVEPADLEGSWRLVGVRYSPSNSGVRHDVSFIDVGIDITSTAITGPGLSGDVSSFEEGSLNWFNSLRIDLSGGAAPFDEMILEGYMVEGGSYGLFWDQADTPDLRPMNGGMLFLVRVP